MGAFVPIPVPLQPVYFARQIETVILAALGTDPALKASGSLGVVTREIVKRQPGDNPHRDYSGKADLPAIWIECEETGEEDGLTTGTELLTFDLTVGVVTEDASTTTARRDCLDVQSAAVRFVKNWIRIKRHTWLEVSGAHGFVPEDGASKERPEQRDGVTGRFEALATIPINVEISLEVW